MTNMKEKNHRASDYLVRKIYRCQALGDSNEATVKGDKHW